MIISRLERLRRRLEKLEPKPVTGEETVVILTCAGMSDEDVIGATAGSVTLAREPEEALDDLIERVRTASFAQTPANGMPLITGYIYKHERLA